MAKCFALVRMNEGNAPDLPWQQMEGEVFNYAFAGPFPDSNWGCYVCSARGAILKDLDDLWPGFIGIVAVTAGDGAIWNEEAGAEIRDRLNTWLANHDKPTIPEHWTNLQIVQRLFQEANERFDFSTLDIKEWDGD